MCLHTEVKGFGTTLGEPRVVWAGYCASSVLEEAEPLGGGGTMFREDESTHDDVRMPVYVFGKTVEDDVCTEEKRGLVVGRHESVVHKDKRVGGVVVSQ